MKKGDIVRVSYRSPFYPNGAVKEATGKVVRVKRDGSYTVSVFDEEEGADCCIDVGKS